MDTVVNFIANNIQDLLLESPYVNNEMVVLNVAPENLKQTLLFLRDEQKCLFVMLISIHAVDYYKDENRFEVNYNLLSLKNNNRLVVKVRVDDKTEVDSIEDIYSASCWYQREVFDLFGIKFKNAKDMRRILTDYNFKGHPLRKDFPLTGYEEVEYDPEKKAVVYKPVKLDQEFRNFDFDSSWTSADYLADSIVENNLEGK